MVAGPLHPSFAFKHGPGDLNSGTEYFSGADTITEILHDREVPTHLSDGGDAVSDEKRQGIRRVQMHVRIPKTRDKLFSPPVDKFCSLRYCDLALSPIALIRFPTITTVRFGWISGDKPSITEMS
jgi:hypothetical protein